MILLLYPYYCEDGEILWRKVVQAETKVRFHPLNNPASCTPDTDDKHVYVYFGNYGPLCYDHAGGKVWERKIEVSKSKYGMATSPILYEYKVILVWDDDGGSSRLLAVNRDSGETAWEQPISLFKANWSTPTIRHHSEAAELVVLGSKRLTSYNPSMDEEIWWASGCRRQNIFEYKRPSLLPRRIKRKGKRA